MSELVKLLQTYDFADVCVILVLGYLAYSEIKKRWKASQTEKKNELEEYHEQQNEIEDKEATLNKRLNKLEERQSNDYARSRGIALEISEIKTQLQQQADAFNNLTTQIRDIRLEAMRNKILDSVPKCIDMTKVSVGSDDYANLFNTYDEYEKILSENDLSNGQCELAIRMIRESYRKRLESEQLTDFAYLPPAEAHEKLKRITDNSAWWREDEK